MTRERIGLAFGTAVAAARVAVSVFRVLERNARRKLWITSVIIVICNIDTFYNLHLHFISTYNTNICKSCLIFINVGKCIE